MESSWIVGLMRQNTDALGFIPSTTVENRYIRRGDYILQCDERGNRIGYLLHGPIYQGRNAHVVQHCIELDKRNRGYGQLAVLELIRRCDIVGASSIRLRCATDLPSLEFWRSCGFVVAAIVPGGEQRQREIAEMFMLFDAPLFSF
jgi:L-amino acid N-acyltransferase YncA